MNLDKLEEYMQGFFSDDTTVGEFTRKLRMKGIDVVLVLSDGSEAPDHFSLGQVRSDYGWRESMN